MVLRMLIKVVPGVGGLGAYFAKGRARESDATPHYLM